MICWLPIDGFEGLYSISSVGSVRRDAPGVGRAREGAILKTAKSKKGYHYLNLCRGGVQKTAYIHRLVCEAFHGPAPSPRHQAAHRDDDKDNNTKANLYWATGLENHADRRRNGRILRGSQIGRATLTEAEAKEIIRRRRSGETCAAIAQDFGVRPHTVSRVAAGTRWGHLAD